MSKLGKKPILIPEKVEASMKDGVLSVKGPLGELKKSFRDDIEVLIKDGAITLKPKDDSQFSTALWGTYVSHTKNMIKGVTVGFEKQLIIEGVGYKAQVEGSKLVLSLGLSHPVKLDIPEGIKVKVEKGNIAISGSDKENVGQFSAEIRATKKPEPYKGKGIRYGDEIIRRKAGKKAITTAI